MATRYAIGAHRWRLGQQLLTETMLLSTLGGTVGLLAGWWALGAITAMRLGDIPRAHEIAIDPVTSAAIIAIAVAVGLLVGLVPLARLSRLNLSSAIGEGGRGGTGGRGTNLLRRSLAIVQVAMAFVLLVGAGLLVASFRQVLRIDPGFDPSGVITASASLPTKGYRDDTAVVEFTTRALEAIRAIPGVESAGTTCCIPFGGKYNDADGLLPEGYTPKKGEAAVSPYFSLVSDGYFETMRVPLVRGRLFTASDTDTSQRVVIIDEALAERFWPGLDPIGRILLRPTGKDEPPKRITVAGVVKAVRLTGLVDQGKRAGAYYYPQAQFVTRNLVFTVRVHGNPEAVSGAMRKALAGVDPLLPLDQVRTMTDRLDMSLVSRRVPMLLATAFGVIALFLSAIGVYGVLAYGVAQRRREIAIRLALGSTARGIFGLVLRDGSTILGAGLALGLAGSLGAGHAMRSMLYDVQPMDAAVLAIVAGTLSMVALVATMIPARRASRVSPTAALNDQ
jgi:predicted permease